MLHLDLTLQEQSILVDLLATCIADLRSEIINTDNPNYKEMLKQRREIFVRLLDSLKSSNEPIHSQ